MTEQGFEDAMQDLLDATGASRTTLRVPADGRFVLAAQAVAPGVPRLPGKDPVDPSAVTTLQWILENGRTLVQDDCATATPRAPDRLLHKYGVKSQILIPVVRDGRVDGVISVHSEQQRDWRESDVTRSERTAQDVAEALGASPRDGS